MTNRKDTPIPDGWEEEFLTKADLERSYYRLIGRTHFFAAALRGRIRSYQLRPDPAWRNFMDAFERLEDAIQEPGPKSGLDANCLIHKGLMEFYVLEHAALDFEVEELEPFEVDAEQLPNELLEKIEALFENCNDTPMVFRLHRTTEAFMKLQCSEYELAAQIFGDLLEKARDEKPEDLAKYHVGLAIAQHNLGDDKASATSIENSGLAVCAAEHTLNRARLSSTLIGIHSYLGNIDESKSWKEFLDRLKCPDATKRVFSKRAELLKTRCKEKARLLWL